MKTRAMEQNKSGKGKEEENRERKTDQFSPYRAWQPWNKLAWTHHSSDPANRSASSLWSCLAPPGTERGRGGGFATSIPLRVSAALHSLPRLLQDPSPSLLWQLWSAPAVLSHWARGTASTGMLRGTNSREKKKKKVVLRKDIVKSYLHSNALPPSQKPPQALNFVLCFWHDSGRCSSCFVPLTQPNLCHVSHFS